MTREKINRILKKEKSVTRLEDVTSKMYYVAMITVKKHTARAKSKWR